MLLPKLWKGAECQKAKNALSGGKGFDYVDYTRKAASRKASRSRDLEDIQKPIPMQHRKIHRSGSGRGSRRNRSGTGPLGLTLPPELVWLWPLKSRITAHPEAILRLRTRRLPF